MFLVNDPYDLERNIKDSEHDRKLACTSYNEGTPNLFMKQNSKLPACNKFINMFTNPGNKIRLQEFLRNEFKMLAHQYKEIKFIYSLRDRCWDLSSEGDVHLNEFQCSHIEADTILLYIYSQLRKNGVQDDVVLDAEDTDVVILAAYVSHQLEGVLGIKRKREIFNCKELCCKRVAEIIVDYSCRKCPTSPVLKTLSAKEPHE